MPTASGLADWPAISTADARSWGELADRCTTVAAWCDMVLETRPLDSHSRDMVRIERANMAEGVTAYRLWADQGRPFRPGDRSTPLQAAST